jgi:hypothetical protein
MAKVLICGVYLADQEHCLADEIEEIGRSIKHEVEQRWIALDVSATGNCDLPHTVAVIQQRTPKFSLLNGLVAGVDSFDYLFVLDDDVGLPLRFLDAYLAYVARFRFALAQPALTLDSNISHPITAQMPGLAARLTRFVEIGPVFSIHRSAFDCLLPFDHHSPMGWGLDFVWPSLIEEKGLRMGIVDATPVAHTLRKTLAYYDQNVVEGEMMELLRTSPHLTYSQACTVIEAYA